MFTQLYILVKLPPLVIDFIFIKNEVYKEAKKWLNDKKDI